MIEVDEGGTQSVEEFIQGLIGLISHLNAEILYLNGEIGLREHLLGQRDETIARFEREREALFDRLVVVEGRLKKASKHLN